MQTIYIEKAVINHPRAQAILNRFKQKRVIECEHYGEIFNRKSQHFRTQKANPALILAQKNGNKVLPTPEGFGIGGQQNYYFSHMLNCMYDCRYCFLQGMYSSAHYVLFLNYEDFMQDISAIANQADKPAYFFSGYDADSLAYEPVSKFLDSFLPFFARQDNAILELRTKTANIRPLLKYTPFNHCVVAFSFTPESISQQVEHGVPALKKRIESLQILANQGWKVGLRFDPLIYADNFVELYRELIQTIFADLARTQLHSVSIGPMRFPEAMYKKMVKLYPEDKLLAHPLERRDKHYSYSPEREREMKMSVLHCLKSYCDEELIFQCHPF